MFNRVLTVFNLHKGIWYPTIVKYASVYVQTSDSATQKGFVNAGSVEINIQADSKKMIQTPGGAVQFVPEKEYAKLSSPEGYITFCPEQDFIFDGEYPDLSPIDDEDYDSGWYNEANNTLDGVYSIVAYGWFALIPHFEIGAK